LRYGIAEDTEIGASMTYSDYQQKNQYNGFNEGLSVANSTNRSYYIYANRKFSLDDMKQTGVILGLSSSLSEQYSIWGAGLNISSYANTSLAQFVLGGSISKEFSKNNYIDNILAEYQVSGFISANKPLANNYLASLSFYINDAHSKSPSSNKFKTNYTIYTGLSYVVSPSFQLTPSFSYLFNNGQSFSFGMNITYVGGW
jgi:hypothetical protein